MIRIIPADTPFQVTTDKIALQCPTGTGELFASVDGETWMTVKSQVDVFNVICNIPKYIYLKLDEDCSITEP